MLLLHRAARWLCVALALSVTVQPLAAQVNEADRIARCQNNAARMQALQAEIAAETTWDEETIARARTALTSMRPLVRRFNSDLQVDGHLITPKDPFFQEILGIGRMFNITCRSEDLGCPSRLLAQIERSIDQGVAALPAHHARVRQWNAHRSNFIALRCDQPAAPTSTTVAKVPLPNISGAWRGPYPNVTFNVTQSGNTYSWQAPQIPESAFGTVEGNAITVTWKGAKGSGTATGRITTDASGLAVRIDWSNGAVFRR